MKRDREREEGGKGIHTSEEKSQERDSQTLEGDELDDHEENLNDNSLLQFQSQEQRQQHFLHFLGAGFYKKK